MIALLRKDRATFDVSGPTRELEEPKSSGAHLIFPPYYDADDRAIDLLHSEEEDAFEDYEIEEQWEL